MNKVLDALKGIVDPGDRAEIEACVERGSPIDGFILQPKINGVDFVISIHTS